MRSGHACAHASARVTSPAEQRPGRRRRGARELLAALPMAPGPVVWIVFWIALCGPVSPAAAQAPAGPRAAGKPGAIPVAVMVVPHGSASDGGELAPERRAELLRGMEQALRADRRLDVRDVDTALAERAGLVPHAALSEARGLVELGEALLARDRAREALPRLTAAVVQLQGMLDHVRLRELARAQFLLGAAHAMAGDAREARRVFEALLIWRPGPMPDSAVASERVTRLWEATAASARKLPRGSVDVVSLPPGARVLVDGEPAGRAPAGADGLTVGTHYVTFELAGYRRAVEEVSIYKHTRRALEQPLEELPGAGEARAHARAMAAAVTGDGDATRAATGLGKLAGVAHAVVLIAPARDASGARYEAAVFDTGTGERLAAASAPADQRPEVALAALARALYAEMLQTADQRQARSDASERRAGASTTPIYERWWFWTGVAAVTAAVVTPVLLQGDGAASCPSGSVCGEVLWRF